MAWLPSGAAAATQEYRESKRRKISKVQPRTVGR
eukprot:CAMPEP_0203987958 /NCGR_PEP_ID=MMETSP0360-20130528/7119_1 /ASSEMBLY_ACC=CAM_ASM_000342 /TAXON_ID=268821 /ORGANISM="Scrippsiella Hangoei, Strain SHTV-5" /LENGTH=33 /DNA_ID= /DNA_START= /DNA_END= /DNA_ORIENTATION=